MGSCMIQVVLETARVLIQLSILFPYLLDFTGDFTLRNEIMVNDIACFFKNNLQIHAI